VAQSPRIELEGIQKNKEVLAQVFYFRLVVN
jgi:hypothetical protein